MMGWHQQGWNGWMIVMMMLWPLVIAGAVWAVVALTGSRERGAVAETPRQILDRRFASGEIDAGQYEQMRELLDNNRMTGPTTTGSG